MRILLPRKNLKKDYIINELENEGYHDIIMAEDNDSFSDVIIALLGADAICVGEGCNRRMSVLVDIAHECGIKVVRVNTRSAIDDITIKACEIYQVKKEAIRRRTRMSNVVQVRMLLAIIMQDRGYSIQETGKYMNKDRATTYYYIKKSKDLLVFDKEFKRNFDILSKIN